MTTWTETKGQKDGRGMRGSFLTRKLHPLSDLMNFLLLVFSDKENDLSEYYSPYRQYEGVQPYEHDTGFYGAQNGYGSIVRQGFGGGEDPVSAICTR